jgi:hypothetical protein
VVILLYTLLVFVYITIFSVSGLHSAPYPLQRNKSDGQILRGGNTDRLLSTVNPSERTWGPPPDSRNNNDPEEAGYVSDVCDYNVQPVLVRRNFPPGEDSPTGGGGGGVIHGKLSLSIAGGGPAAAGRSASPPEFSRGPQQSSTGGPGWAQVSLMIHPAYMLFIYFQTTFPLMRQEINKAESNGVMFTPLCFFYSHKGWLTTSDFFRFYFSTVEKNGNAGEGLGAKSDRRND